MMREFVVKNHCCMMTYKGCTMGLSFFSCATREWWSVAPSPSFCDIVFPFSSGKSFAFNPLCGARELRGRRFATPRLGGEKRARGGGGGKRGFTGSLFIGGRVDRARPNPTKSRSFARIAHASPQAPPSTTTRTHTARAHRHRISGASNPPNPLRGKSV